MWKYEDTCNFGLLTHDLNIEITEQTDSDLIKSMFL